MASSLPKKVFIQIESSTEQQENLKATRKQSRTLAVLQKTGTTDKENLIGRQPAYIAKEHLIRKTIESDNLQTPESKRKTPTPCMASTSSQTSPSLQASAKVTVEDLTSESVGEHYWEVLAEKRRSALEESLTENQELYERIATLEDELNQSKSLLAETRSLVEVLTEMLEEKESSNDDIDTTMNSENNDIENDVNDEQESTV